MKVIFTCGVQASGKSFWAKQFVKDNQNYKRVNRDSIRHMISNYTHDDKNEKLVTKIEKEIITQIIKDGYNLVVDNMNLNKKYLDELKNFIHSVVKDGTTLDFEVKEFPISLHEAVERDKNRIDSVGEAVIKKTWKKYEIELKQMLDRHKTKYVEDINLPKAVLIDIDGTLSNSIHRRIFDDEAVINDLVIKPVKKLVNLIYANTGTKVIIFSGRKDSCKTQTEEWLKKNFISYHELHMRKATDNRNDTIVKSEMFEEFIRGKYYCEFVIDDRHAVCNMYVEEKGLFLFCVNQDPLARNVF